MLSQLFTGPDPQTLLQQSQQHWREQFSITTDTHPDLSIVPEDSPEHTSIKINHIRQLNQTALLRPSQVNTKLIIIHQAHLMTPEAQNALLKTLEEPPAQTQINLTSTQPHSLLTTILSRVATRTPDKNTQQKVNIDTERINKILTLPPTQRLTLTAELASDRPTAIETVTQLLHHTHQQLINSPSETQHQHNLRRIQKALDYLNANTHHQLTMDNLLLHLK